MSNRTPISTALALLSVLVVGACEQEDPTRVTRIQEPGYAAFDSTFASNPNRRFDQVERLGNPLVMEVLVQKREHDAYNSMPPRQDVGHFTDDIVAFVTSVTGRPESYGQAIAGALVGTVSSPGDKLTVFTNRAAGVTAAGAPDAATVGWLTYVLDPANGYGGRKLRGDDTVDKGLSVLFGTALGLTTNVSPGLVTDNVPANDKTPNNTFPYFPAPTQ